MLDLDSKDNYQRTFFNNSSQINDQSRKSLLMKSLDKINQKMGRGTVFFAAQGITRTWAMRSVFKSPHYTTDWDEIPRALASAHPIPS